jgi:DNA-binding protein Fis
MEEPTALDRYRQAVQARRAAEDTEHAALLDVLRARVRGWQAEAARISGQSRETIRRKARDAGIEPDER